MFSSAVATESTLEISYLEVTENGHVSAGQLINIIQPTEIQNDTAEPESTDSAADSVADGEPTKPKK